jgi:hypothetical protein
MEKYAVTMSDNIISNGKNIKLIFNYLDNWNECYQEAANFLYHKDYNLQYSWVEDENRDDVIFTTNHNKMVMEYKLKNEKIKGD